MDLFYIDAKEKSFKDLPLAVRMRPRKFSEYIGQEHIVGKDTLLKRAIEADRLTSLILFGAPGTGKTSLAYLIGSETSAFFEKINATTSSVEELRKIIASAKNRKASSEQKTILFVDEIHRFNKAQQDVLMPDVEEANIILIGATVHNPFFSVIAPLVSRSIVFELKPLTDKDITRIIEGALLDKERGLGGYRVNLDKKAKSFLAKICDGDARRALNALEIGTLTTPASKNGEINFSLEVAESSIQKKAVVYDKDGDGHYDTISAFIKSMRGTDPDATLYWLAKMLYAGEDPLFVARRICICASEDVGNADPLALVLASSAFSIVEFVGMPEARIVLAQAALYVACAPKSNAAYLGIESALSDAKKEQTKSIPDSLKGTGYSQAKKLGHGQGYKYAHDYANHFVEQSYMPDKKIYYNPTDIGYELKIKKHLKALKSANKPADNEKKD
jgi:putative ATPase